MVKNHMVKRKWKEKRKKWRLGKGSEMAKYQGKSVRLNKPSRITKGQAGYGRKKFKVFVKSGSKVKKVMFGDPNMKIKKSNPARRKSFRARHKCSTAKDKTTARYWSCKKW